MGLHYIIISRVNCVRAVVVSTCALTHITAHIAPDSDNFPIEYLLKIKKQKLKKLKKCYKFKSHSPLLH